MINNDHKNDWSEFWGFTRSASNTFSVFLSFLGLSRSVQIGLYVDEKTSLSNLGTFQVAFLGRHLDFDVPYID